MVIIWNEYGMNTAVLGLLGECNFIFLVMRYFKILQNRLSSILIDTNRPALGDGDDFHGRLGRANVGKHDRGMLVLL